MSGLTLDAGGLIALDRSDRRVISLIARTTELGARTTIPATVLAQAMRNPKRQALVSRILRQPGIDVVPSMRRTRLRSYYWRDLKRAISLMRMWCYARAAPDNLL